MQKTYFNSRLEEDLYKKIKVEAVNKGIPIKDHIASILREYVILKYPEVLSSKPLTSSKKKGDRHGRKEQSGRGRGSEEIQTSG